MRGLTTLHDSFNKSSALVDCRNPLLNVQTINTIYPLGGATAAAGAMLLCAYSALLTVMYAKPSCVVPNAALF